MLVAEEAARRLVVLEVQRLGLFRPSHAAVEDGQVVQGFHRLGMLVAEHLPPPLESPLARLLRELVFAEPDQCPRVVMQERKPVLVFVAVFPQEALDSDREQSFGLREPLAVSVEQGEVVHGGVDEVVEGRQGTARRRLSRTVSSRSRGTAW